MALKCAKTTAVTELFHHSKKWAGRLTQALWHATVGFFFGYFLLHPISMIIFRWFDVTSGHGFMTPERNPFWEPILTSFNLHMLPMGLAFAAISALFAVMGGHQHATIKMQRDALKNQLILNEGYRNELMHQAELLIAKNEELKRIERARERATQFMVHDLKNHLGCILGHSNLLLQKTKSNRNEEFSDALERICRQAYQMDMDIKNFLDVGYLQEGTGTLQKTEVCAHDLIKLSTTGFRLPSHQKRVNAGKNNGHYPTVLGDAQLLRRVFENLISNALKHNPPGTQVVLNVEEDGDDFAVFSCMDNGNGIPADLNPLISNAFHARSSEVDDSTGLGLTFCKAAVEAHGGRIWYESSRGQGTCFYFTIPKHKEVRKMKCAASYKKRVLVVDDEPDFAVLIESILKEEGYDAIVSFDADQALERVKDWSPDMITLDIRMPRKSGLFLYRQLKSCPEFCDIPVVLISGVTREDPRTKIMIQPFLEADHLPLPPALLEKPIDREDLLRVVHEGIGSA